MTVTAGDNVILGGVGKDEIHAAVGTTNIIAGDNGVVNLNQVGVDADNVFSIVSGPGALGDDDQIFAGSNNIILGGFGKDHIELGGGVNTVVGRNGQVSRRGTLDATGHVVAAVTRIFTTDTTGATGDDDTILSQGGTNVILGGVGKDHIETSVGTSNIVLGDNGQVVIGGDIFTTEPGLGRDDTVIANAENTIPGGFGAGSLTPGGGTTTVLGGNSHVTPPG